MEASKISATLTKDKIFSRPEVADSLSQRLLPRGKFAEHAVFSFGMISFPLGLHLVPLPALC